MLRIIVLAILLGLPALAAADYIIWDNYPSGPGFQAHSSQWGTVYAWASQVADDFEFSSPGEPWAITGVHWVGRFWNPPGHPALGEPYDILFYADDGTGQAPTGAGLYIPDITALRQYELLYPTETPLGDDRFECEIDLPEPFLAETGSKYWIAIRWRSPFPPQWGIVDSTDSWGATAKQGFPLLNIPYWTGDLQVDVAFKLAGYQTPEPGGMVPLMWSSLIAGARRRG